MSVQQDNCMIVRIVAEHGVEVYGFRDMQVRAVFVSDYRRLLVVLVLVC